MKRYISKAGLAIKRKYQEDPFASIVLWGLFFGAVFMIFAFRGLIATAFLPKVDIDKNPQVTQSDDSTTKKSTEPINYKVQSGDTIYSLGSKFSVSWSKIAETIT
jgi:hypothetical protein